MQDCSSWPSQYPILLQSGRVGKSSAWAPHCAALCSFSLDHWAFKAFSYSFQLWITCLYRAVWSWVAPSHVGTHSCIDSCAWSWVGCWAAWDVCKHPSNALLWDPKGAELHRSSCWSSFAFGGTLKWQVYSHRSCQITSAAFELEA